MPQTLISHECGAMENFIGLNSINGKLLENEKTHSKEASDKLIVYFLEKSPQLSPVGTYQHYTYYYEFG